MLKTRGLVLAATVAAAALSIPATAGAQGAVPFTYGQCVSTGFPDPSQGGFGPEPLVFLPSGSIVFQTPPGQLANGNTGISCPVGF